MRRTSAYGQEEALSSGVRCLVANRMDYGIDTLGIGTFSKRQDGAKTATLPYFTLQKADGRGIIFCRMATRGQRAGTANDSISRNGVSDPEFSSAMLSGPEHYPCWDSAL